jgi:hypothetical protein
MRALMALVIGMGVLIVAGTAVIGVTIVKRMSAGGAVAGVPLVLDEPAGTRIVSVGGAGDKVAVVLSGGGPDRVVLWDVARGVAVGRLRLAK